MTNDDGFTRREFLVQSSAVAFGGAAIPFLLAESTASAAELPLPQGEIRFDRYSDRARKVVQLAYQAADRTGAKFVGTDHILLGLIREGSGVAAHIVKSLGVRLDEMRWEVEVYFAASVGPPLLGPLRRSETILQYSTPQLKGLFECAANEARDLQHNYVGTEHLLLALLRQRDGIAPVLLSRQGLKHEIVQAEVRKLLGLVART